MNLENLNLVELNAQELQEAEGGAALPVSAQGNNYNHVLSFLFGPLYDASYILGKYF